MAEARTYNCCRKGRPGALLRCLEHTHRLALLLSERKDHKVRKTHTEQLVALLSNLRKRTQSTLIRTRPLYLQQFRASQRLPLTISIALAAGPSCERDVMMSSFL